MEGKGEERRGVRECKGEQGEEGEGRGGRGGEGRRDRRGEKVHRTASKVCCVLVH